ncbi:MAG: hypothetical protein D6805_08905 [Planctomycetota bacterium]|nr:MAG: hypothetical protein D6805_08905 [Planctomycetota bacterium]
MAINNQIRKVTKRTRGFEDFDENRILQAIRRAALDYGGFLVNVLDETFHQIYQGKSEEQIAQMLVDDIILCLNSHSENLIPYHPPLVERIQDIVEHVLYSRGFIEIAEVYHVFRSGRALIREKEIGEEQFAGNGFPREFLGRLELWNRERNCASLEELNEIVLRGKLQDLIDASIAEYEFALDEAARKFLSNPKVRVMVITGPSSSGKTTTTHKLKERLRREGVRFKTLELDNYFWDLQQHPRDAFGDYNYEIPESLDLISINRHVLALLEGEVVDVPVYNFKTGSRESFTRKFRLNEDEVLLLDSLYGLFPAMLKGVAKERRFQLYIETLTPLEAELGSQRRWIPFTDYRLLRRMLRDAEHRNSPPEQTLAHWHYVRKGELNDIIPRIFVADFILNGGLLFELPVLKQCIEDRFPDYQKYLDQRRLDPYIRGKRVKGILDKVVAANLDLGDYRIIPEDCHLREFIGGGKYSQHGQGDTSE